MTKPLADIRVLDLSIVRAGPVAVSCWLIGVLMSFASNNLDGDSECNRIETVP